MTWAKQPAVEPSARPTPTPLDHVNAIVNGLRTIAECARDIEQAKARQTQVKEEARVEVERIGAMRDVLMSYLDKSFDERRQNFDTLFRQLDSAIAGDNVALVSVILESVVKLADSSPFTALADPATTRALLADKKTEWNF